MQQTDGEDVGAHTLRTALLSCNPRCELSSVVAELVKSERRSSVAGDFRVKVEERYLTFEPRQRQFLFYAVGLRPHCEEFSEITLWKFW